MISICLLRQLKARLLSSHLPHKFAQTAVSSKSASDKIGKLHDDLAFYEERHGC